MVGDEFRNPNQIEVVLAMNASYFDIAGHSLVVDPAKAAEIIRAVAIPP